ncbi:aspartyl-phosphate phosphatase Spo0E family protein [Bacillus dakarensis]|uniref:aspartyl-phosphate phosphatase Spo0E family protein n=1 Tax=Robertmurraya dakarensis TaxID=1926278 RepID=UPI000980E606|nr:aspartyl-phosphate phosphatase Spo0E family protein [Bacillus dakarensis]
MKVDLDCLDLNKDIKDLRNQMIDSGLTKGLSHPETIKYSQKLDQLINIHQKFNQQEINP